MTDDQNLGDQNISTAGRTADGAARTGPPWEAGPASLNGFIATAKDVLLEPTAFFTLMRREGGLGGPLLYGLIGVTLGAMFGIVAQGAFSGFGVPGFPSEAREAVGSAVGIVALMIIAPVFALVGLFIGSAICHVLLLLIGGARFPYETTFRVICYSSGSTSLVNIVPVCGGLIAAVWSIVVSIIGVAQAHEISTGKATLAVLGPMVVCCTAFILLLSLMFVVGFAAVSGEFMELMRKLLAALETRRV